MASGDVIFETNGNEPRSITYDYEDVSHVSYTVELIQSTGTGVGFRMLTPTLHFSWNSSTGPMPINPFEPGKSYKVTITEV